jgi:hypothetical protein
MVLIPSATTNTLKSRRNYSLTMAQTTGCVSKELPFEILRRPNVVLIPNIISPNNVVSMILGLPQQYIDWYKYIGGGLECKGWYGEYNKLSK